MKFYYINLDGSTERKLEMEKRYDYLIRISAYDGNMLDKYDDIVIPTNTLSSNYELACSFSHLKAIQTAYNNGDEGAIILEDDIHNDYKEKWGESLEQIIKNSPVDSDCVILFCINPKQINKMIKMKKKYSKWHPLYRRWSTGSYYIKRKGMKKLLDKYIVNGKIDLSKTNYDKIVYKSYRHQADVQVIYGNLKSYNYTKPLFNHTGKESYIHNFHLNEGGPHQKSLLAIQKYFSN